MILGLRDLYLLSLYMCGATMPRHFPIAFHSNVHMANVHMGHCAGGWYFVLCNFRHEGDGILYFTIFDKSEDGILYFAIFEMRLSWTRRKR